MASTVVRKRPTKGLCMVCGVPHGGPGQHCQDSAVPARTPGARTLPQSGVPQCCAAHSTTRWHNSEGGGCSPTAGCTVAAVTHPQCGGVNRACIHLGGRQVPPVLRVVDLLARQPAVEVVLGKPVVRAPAISRRHDLRRAAAGSILLRISACATRCWWAIRHRINHCM
jgi:hypothetical protein